jgi:hypothetical protein
MLLYIIQIKSKQTKSVQTPTQSQNESHQTFARTGTVNRR